MPVKRRLGKRRLGDAAEVQAWSDLFTCGYDHFGDLEPFGFPTNDADRAARAAAREAWERLGGAFMADWQPSGPRDKPWALEQFGEPN